MNCLDPLLITLQLDYILACAREETKIDQQARSLTEQETAARHALDVRYRASLTRFFSRRVPDAAEVDDMVQDVFERLLKRGRVAELELQQIGGYVFSIASSVIADRLRRRQVRHAGEHDPFDSRKHGDVDFSPEDVLLGRERLARASAALLELPERTRTIFVLRRLEGMKYLDIAARLSISRSAVEKHMERAIAHLNARLDAE